MITIVAVPYHLGQRDLAVGVGPTQVLATGIAERLNAPLTVLDVGPHRSWRAVNTALAASVQQLREEGSFPLILAGNCNSCLGTLAGINDPNLGIVWLDAHGDFHTTETSVSGSLEGMSLTLATLEFVAENRVILVAARDLDAGEVERVRDLLLYVSADEFVSARLPNVQRVYVHVDIDVLDPSISSGVNFQGTGGLTVDQLLAVLAFTFDRFDVVALAITNYNPDRDIDHRTRDIIASLITNISRLHRTAASR